VIQLAAKFTFNNEDTRNLRKMYLIFAITVIFLGLASRKFSHVLPLFLMEEKQNEWQPAIRP